ncbi:hypothetical protein POM88_036445 [Heracleum sosnowskyi]|uniref:Uncharacterized protein n=1 Tax=Heracleum sosnowskyi TaxID=360622 RepID=A0AAD8MFN3_9APIA|nr:hypothetical protein POM88_036445 [Heracleum sosnowskyi]
MCNNAIATYPFWEPKHSSSSFSGNYLLVNRYGHVASYNIVGGVWKQETDSINHSITGSYVRDGVRYRNDNCWQSRGECGKHRKKRPVDLLTTNKKSTWDQTVNDDEEVCDAQQAPSTLFDQSQRSKGLQTDDGRQRKFSIGTNERKGQRDGDSNRVEEVSFETAEELKIRVREVAQEKAGLTGNNRNDPLQMKIWEVLATVKTTPTKQFFKLSDSEELKVNSLLKNEVQGYSFLKKDVLGKINSATIGGSSVFKSEMEKSSRIEPQVLHFPKHSSNAGGLRGFSSKENRDTYQYPIMEKADNLG